MIFRWFFGEGLGAEQANFLLRAFGSPERLPEVNSDLEKGKTNGTSLHQKTSLKDTSYASELATRYMYLHPGSSRVYARLRPSDGLAALRPESQSSPQVMQPQLPEPTNRSQRTSRDAWSWSWSPRVVVGSPFEWEQKTSKNIQDLSSPLVFFQTQAHGIL